jgi:hypothetical protein
MHQVYRILRDNKEKGPLSLEELLQLSLKPFDLIWVEGRSAGWRYPSEIETLKPYLEGNESQKDIPAPARQVHPASQNTRPLLNTAAPQMPQPAMNEGTAPGEEEEMTAEKLERKAAEIYMRVQAYNQKAQEQQEGVQTKYARSLEDLKQEYADWLHKKKAKKKFALPKNNTKVIAVLASSLLIICAAWYFMGATKRSSYTIAIEKEPAHVQSAAFVSEPPVNNENKVYHPAPEITSAPNSNFAQRKELSVDEFIDSVERVLASTSHMRPIPRPSKKTESTATQVLNVDTGTNHTIPAAIAPGEKRPQPTGPLVKMDAHYQESNRRNVASLEVTIRNNGDDLLRSVAVDVFYYKKGERLFDKETLYFNNILPGNSLTVSKPANKKAVSARFQLGQVTTSDN